MQRINQQIYKIFGTAIFLVLLFSESAVYAGMPTIALSRYGAERLIGISTAIFIVMIVTAIPVMFCWNALVAGSNRFKRLNYAKSLGVVFLGGCFFVLILAMIAGSRELFSPGAWVPNGIVSQTLYNAEMERLAQLKENKEHQLNLTRYEAILKLRDALQTFAKEHHDQLPASIEESEFGNLWLIPFAAGMSYEYFPETDSESSISYAPPLVREPAILPDARFAIGREFEITEKAK
ncbi:MAG: hypothetical protein LBG58_07660 [Planctomycetaceae bacterium]|jgi:hypothetical protein|nr:hypothetical protein [Planctomycetaceae bacterium]